jgi:transposase
MIGSTSLTAGCDPVRVWLATSPLDMRCGFDRLAEHVRTILLADPTSGHLFVFRGKSGDHCKDPLVGPQWLLHLLQAAGTRHVPVPDIKRRASSGGTAS